jgi:phosphatidylserine/phosphatidylglycerophosphate/cardiolipin synthase-like enzyme
MVVVGSANLSNRSMGLDSECCLAVEAKSRDGIEEGIARLCTRLLAEHTGASPESVTSACNRHQSLNKAIESLQGSSGRRLEDLDYEPSLPLGSVSIVPDQELLDPESPVVFDRMLYRFARQGGVVKNCGRLSRWQVFC